MPSHHHVEVAPFWGLIRLHLDMLLRGHHRTKNRENQKKYFHRLLGHFSLNPSSRTCCIPYKFSDTSPCRPASSLWQEMQPDAALQRLWFKGSTKNVKNPNRMATKDTTQLRHFPVDATKRLCSSVSPHWCLQTPDREPRGSQDSRRMRKGRP